MNDKLLASPLPRSHADGSAAAGCAACAEVTDTERLDFLITHEDVEIVWWTVDRSGVLRDRADIDAAIRSVRSQPPATALAPASDGETGSLQPQKGGPCD